MHLRKKEKKKNQFTFKTWAATPIVGEDRNFPKMVCPCIMALMRNEWHDLQSQEQKGH